MMRLWWITKSPSKFNSLKVVPAKRLTLYTCISESFSFIILTHGYEWMSTIHFHARQPLKWIRLLLVGFDKWNLIGMRPHRRKTSLRWSLLFCNSSLYLVCSVLLMRWEQRLAKSSRSSFTFSYNLKACVSLEQIKKTTRFRYSRGSTSLKLEGGGGSEYK
jgi:hypothetical protein